MLWKSYIPLFVVTVHYRAWVENSSHKFEDTWQEQHPIELILGKGMPIRLLSFTSFNVKPETFIFMQSLIFPYGMAIF